MTMLDISDLSVREGSQESGRIRMIRLARPPVNALNRDLVRELSDAVKAAKDASAIVISGQPGLFSAGLDVPSLLALGRESISEFFIDLWRLLRAIAASPTPVVFSITGHCPAGGTVLAIQGDYRVMAKGEFRLGLNEVQVGLFPGGVIHDAFKRLVGGHAGQLLTRGALIDPATALRVGLVDELCEPDQVESRSLELAREISLLPREPMLRTRALVRQDLVDLYGGSGDTGDREREFGVMGHDMWFAPAAQERLKAAFTKKR
jgi:enoyl-CoA hydratase/carnithine racemase